MFEEIKIREFTVDKKEKEIIICQRRWVEGKKYEIVLNNYFCY
jgi:hypothetical protein